MSKTLNTAIIGCGKVAHYHATALQQIPESNFVAVQGRNPDRVTEFAGKYGVNPHTDIAQMISKENVSVVIICTPHPAHRDPALAAIRAGAHVLIEKPLAITLKDCDEIIELSETHKKKLGVISQRRLFPASMRMKKAIAEEKIGKPALCTVQMLGWRDENYYRSDPWRGSWEMEGGGVLVNQAPHMLDLMQWFMDDKPEELFGYWENINHPYIDVDDTALAMVKFKNGGLASIMVSNSQKPGIYGKIHVHGSNGASVGVQTDGGAMFIAGVPTAWDPPFNDLWTVPGEEDDREAWQEEDAKFFRTIDPIEYFLRLQDWDFIRAVLEKKEPVVTGLEGRKTTELFTAIYQSNKTKQPVRWPLSD